MRGVWQQLRDEQRASTGALLSLFQSIWNGGVIPDTYRDVAIVPLFEKGSPLDVDNYRGIALIEVVLKLLARVSAAALSDALETTGRLSVEQGGFRRQRECAGQYIALYDLTRERARKGICTYAAFLDFAKAFDSVPISALLAKVKAIGCGGRNFQFITSLYQKCRASMINGSARGEPFDVSVGVRQGCPLSPILFAVFIDDLPRRVQWQGVPYMADGTLLGSLLFADDCVLVSPTVESLKCSLAEAQQWANDWGLQFNVSKCGAMGFGPGAQSHLSRSSACLMLGANQVPVVDSYTYLGVPMTFDLNLRAQKKVIVARLSRSLIDLGRLVRQPQLPIATSLQLVRSFALAACAYGSELLGMNKVNSHGVCMAS